MVSRLRSALPLTSAGEGLLDQFYLTGDDSFIHLFGSSWYAQTFTPDTSHQISKVYLKLEKEGSPGIITVSVRATSAGKPTGADLASGTRDLDLLSPLSGGSWYDFDLGAGTALTASTLYALVVRTAGADTNNDGQWRIDITSSSYSGGTDVNSSDAGVTWDAPGSSDMLFKEGTK